MGLNRHMSVQAVWRGAWPTAGEPLAIVLPGREQSVQFALEIVTRLSLPSLNCVALSAEGNTWYPGRFMAPIESNQPDIDHSLERIESLVGEAESRGISRNQIALLGFSQGACVVCEYVYRHPVRWGTVVSFTGGLIGPEDQRWETDGPGLADIVVCGAGCVLPGGAGVLPPHAASSVLAKTTQAATTQNRLRNRRRLVFVSELGTCISR